VVRCHRLDSGTTDSPVADTSDPATTSAPQTAYEGYGVEINDVNLQERAGAISAEEARNRINIAQCILANDGLTQQERWSIQGDLKELLTPLEQALDNTAQAANEVAEELRKQRAMPEGVWLPKWAPCGRPSQTFSRDRLPAPNTAPAP